MRKLLAIILLVLILWLQYRIWIGANSQQKLDQINLQIQQQQQQLELLKKLNRELQQESVLLRNDPDILEEKAREKMGMIKKKEMFYRVIVEPKKLDEKN